MMSDKPYIVEPKSGNNVRVNYRYVTDVMGVPLRWFIEFVEHVNDCVEYSVVLDKVIEELEKENEKNHEKLERIGDEIDRFKADFPDRD